MDVNIATAILAEQQFGGDMSKAKAFVEQAHRYEQDYKNEVKGESS